MKKMRPVPRIEVKAGGETKLEPGGLHIMLIGLEQPLKEGASVALTLSFEDGSTKDVTAPVRAIAPSASMSHGHRSH
jgi:hypothetical protein